ASRPVRPNKPNRSWAVATAAVVPVAARIHDPTLIGDVTLNTRSMLKNRAGTPRSRISKIGLPVPAARQMRPALRASLRLPVTSAVQASIADAPVRPPKKKYQGTSGFQTGALMTGRP